MKGCIIKNDLKFQQQSMENSKRNHKKQERLTHSRRVLSQKVNIHSKSINELAQAKPNTVKSDLKNNRLDDNKKSSFQVGNNNRKQGKSITKQNIRQPHTKEMANKYKSNNRKSGLQKLSFLAPHIAKSVKLLLATLLDITTIQSHLKQTVSFRAGLSSISPSSIPYIYRLIVEYEDQFARAYTQEIRYYIIGTLWDQGYCKIGAGDEWQKLIQEQYKEQKQQKKGINKLNTQIVLLIQCVEEQYHRQQITLSKLIENLSKQNSGQLTANSTYKSRMENYSYRYKIIEQLLYQIFDTFDSNKLGTLGLASFIQQFYIQHQPQPQQVVSKCIVNKVCNNVHNFDKSTNSISNPYKHTNNKNIKQPNEYRIHIENIIQLINRIYRYQPNAYHQQMQMSEHVCSTYNSIAYILTKYTQMKGLVYQQMQSHAEQQANTTNDGILIRAEMDNIRRAATTIVKCRKIHLVDNISTEQLQYQNYLMNQLHIANSNSLYLNSKLESLYQTNKHQPNMADDEQLTFRHKTQQMRLSDVNKEMANSALSRGSEEKLRKNASKGRDTASTATGPMHRQVKDNSIYSIQNSAKTRDRKDQFASIGNKLEIRIQEQTAQTLNQKMFSPKQHEIYNPEIRQFTIQKQPVNFHCVPGKEEIIDPFNFHINQNYDRLLRYRIQNELRTVELQKLKNRMKYYQIMYQ